MPERSEWLLADGGAKRNPRYRDGSHVAKDAKTVAKEADIRVLRFSFDGGYSGGCANAYPRLRALGLSPSAFNLSGWIPPQQLTASPPGDAINRGNAAY